MMMGVIKFALTRQGSYLYSLKPKPSQQNHELLLNQQQPSLWLCTFHRQVLAQAFNPGMNNKCLHEDARRRAGCILEKMISVGSYPPGLGFHFIRQNVSKYIARVDRIPPPKVQNIFLCYGLAQALEVVLKTLICTHNDTIMIPRPFHPLLPKSIMQRGGTPAYYELTGNQKWQITKESLEFAYESLICKGRSIKAIVVVNPGNPSGISLSMNSIANVLQFAVKRKLVVIAQQEYPHKIFTEFNSNQSFLGALSQMSSQIRQQCELVSIHSVSKALAFQASYIYFHNIAPQTMDELIKIQSMGAFGSSLSQLMVELKVNPLQQSSQQTQSLIRSEEEEYIRVKVAKGKILSKALGQMQKISVVSQQAAKYVYCEVMVPQRVRKVLGCGGLSVDKFYCNEANKNTGTALIAGSYFGESGEGIGFRMSPSIMAQQHLQKSLLLLKSFNKQFHQYYKK